MQNSEIKNDVFLLWSRVGIVVTNDAKNGVTVTETKTIP